MKTAGCLLAAFLLLTARVVRADDSIKSSSPDESRSISVDWGQDGVNHVVLFLKNRAGVVRKEVNLGDLSGSSIAPDEVDIAWPKKGSCLVVFIQFRHGEINYLVNSDSARPSLIELKEPDWVSVFSGIGVSATEPNLDNWTDADIATFEHGHFVSVKYSKTMDNASYEFIATYDLSKNGALSKVRRLKEPR